MINEVKVSKTAVCKFEDSVTKMYECADKISSAIQCLEELIRLIAELIKRLMAVINKENHANEKLEVKIREFEQEIDRLNAKLDDLERELDDLERELDSTPESFTFPNSEGEVVEVPNPAYEILCQRISIVEAQIESVEKEIDKYQQKLDQAYNVNHRIDSHIEKVNGVISSLEEKSNTCNSLVKELSDIKASVSTKSLNASMALKKIEQLIDSYLKIKMKYEQISFINPSDNARDINININVNVSNPQTNEFVNDKYPGLTSKDIKNHNIKFDSNNRISEYDGKKFGENYNTYKDRFEQTPQDNNPIKGTYEGIRGESKFIPSGRTVEGQVVIKILKEYGLDGIQYRNAEPDFEVCSEAVVKIKNMTNNRYDFKEAGVVKEGNFTQADNQLAVEWNLQSRNGKSNWTPKDVYDYRKSKGLTWHEKCDTETMVLVKSEINAFFTHSGGCSACGVRDGVNAGGDFDE